MEWVADHPAVKIEGQTLLIWLRERLQGERHVATNEEIAAQARYAWDRPRQWDFSLSGRLRLSIMTDWYGFKTIYRTWSDGKKQRVEGCLGHILETLPQIAELLNQRDFERDQENAIRENEERNREVERQRLAEYERKAKVVSKCAGLWQDCNLFRQFAERLQATLATENLPDSQRDELEAFISWITTHADLIDPFHNLKDVLDEFKPPPKPEYDFH